MDDRLTRLEDKIDRLTDAVGEIRSDVRVLQVTLDEHDARSAKALIRANEAYQHAEEAHAPLQFLSRLGSIGKWLGWVSGGIAVLYALLDWLRNN